MEGDAVGLTTRRALSTLRSDITELLQQHHVHISRVGFLRAAVSLSSEKVLLSGAGYCVTSLYVLLLVVGHVVGESVLAGWSVLVQAGLLTALVLGNLALAAREEALRRTEMHGRVRHVLRLLDRAVDEAVWTRDNYPHLCAPFSPCVTLQWTYRDGALVNLPWALLVRGDVIVVRPGQELPGLCTPLKEQDAAEQHPPKQTKEKISQPTVRKPHENKTYVMSETVYLKNLEMALRQAQDRPDTVHNQLRYLVTVRVVEGTVLPLSLALVLVSSVVRHVYPPRDAARALWTELYLLDPVAATLPLLMLVFPLLWLLINSYALARFKLLSESKERREETKAGEADVAGAEEALLEGGGACGARGGRDTRRLAAVWLRIALGREDMITRTANIVHVLGSLSALCVVDKKGILSWPNPTAEKVLFLRSPEPLSRASSDSSLDSERPQDRRRHVPGNTAVAEVLDLTHSQDEAFGVEFDDQTWRQHLPALRPLGLAALLNTCAAAPRHTYAHLCAHLVCEAQLSEDLVPVTNRRCLCELAQQIGFQKQATELYSVHESLAVFRHLQADTIRRETRFARSLHLSSRVKVPLPHMLSTIVTDPFRRRQLLSQGTADIVLDTCVDYWNGRDLVPLTASDRKKILDFYQRSSLTAYCTAFSYKPLTRSITSELASLYLELPADCRQLYPSCLHSCPHELFHSSDSLLLNAEQEEDATDANGFFELESNQVFLGMVTMQYQAQSDMVELVERLERACVRFVHFSKENELRSRVFSEKMGLESGWNCHISLMSDPPASCAESAPSSPAPAPAPAPPRTHRHTTQHASLAPLHAHSALETARPLSMSAPGAINTELATVKFESETRARHSIPASHDKRDSVVTEYGLCVSGDSGEGTGSAEEDSPLDACRSLSCLTDSTDRSAPLNFDTSNRAKLPRGIEHIREHIERVDNVPLLVSLFTDCTAGSARRMIRIMQDYGEVVCVVGSAANKDNMQLFMQADASIAMEPLYPVLCQQLAPYVSPARCVGPVALARTLNAISCSISSVRGGDVSLLSLVTLSRHLVTCLWNATQFWVCAVCTISAVQVLSVCAWLGPCVSLGGAAWLSLAAVPALSCSLVCRAPAPDLMSSAARHARHPAPLHTQAVLHVVWCYGLKMAPAALSVVALFAATLRTFCQQISEWDETVSCHVVYPVRSGPAAPTAPAAPAPSWRDSHYDSFYLAQNIALTLLTVLLIVISASFVERGRSAWRAACCRNTVWCLASLLVLAGQGAWWGAALHWRWPPAHRLPPPLLCAYLAAPILVFALNELVKWQEIKANVRYQRRARLEFGTKLGMNSPF